MFTKVVKTLNRLIERLTPKQLLFGIALIGILVALAVYMTLNHIESSLKVEQSKAITMTKVVVAKVDIARGAVIKQNMLTVKEFATSSLPKGTSGDIEEFVNLPTKLEIFAGDFLTFEKVFTDYRQAGFIGMIPDNCRAVTISVNNVTGIAGLLKAGDYVDVLLISNVNGSIHSEVILQNVLLLSINQNANRYVQPPKTKDSSKHKEDTADNKESTGTDLNVPNELPPANNADSKESDDWKTEVAKLTGIPSASSVGTVTLALKTDEVAKITAVSSSGRIYLALRPLKPRGDSMYITENDYYTLLS